MINKIYKKLYIFFFTLFIFFIFFSTNNLQAKIYKVKDIEIIAPYNLEFNKNIVIDNAFQSAFELLMKRILNTKNLVKIMDTKIENIKEMVVSFEITDEKFINKNYSANINVLFDKKLILSYLNKKNIISSIPNEKKILFIPIIIDIGNNEIMMYNENIFFTNWNLFNEKHHLLNYFFLEEDIDDFNLIKKNLENIENYDLDIITSKYNKNEYIFSIFYLNNNNIDVLTKIKINKQLNIFKSNFKNINLKNENNLKKLISELKIDFENRWKKYNEINPSIKLPLSISLDSKNLSLINDFENILNSSDLVSEYTIDKITSFNSIYRIIYNSTPDKFISNFEKNNFKIDISNKIWTINYE